MKIWGGQSVPLNDDFEAVRVGSSVYGFLDLVRFETLGGVCHFINHWEAFSVQQFVGETYAVHVGAVRGLVALQLVVDVVVQVHFVADLGFAASTFHARVTV